MTNKKGLLILALLLIVAVCLGTILITDVDIPELTALTNRVEELEHRVSLLEGDLQPLPEPVEITPEQEPVEVIDTNDPIIPDAGILEGINWAIEGSVLEIAPLVPEITWIIAENLDDGLGYWIDPDTGEQQHYMPDADGIVHVLVRTTGNIHWVLQIGG